MTRKGGEEEKKKKKSGTAAEGGNEDRGRQRRVLGLPAKIAQMPRPWRMSGWLITVRLAPEMWPI